MTKEEQMIDMVASIISSDGKYTGSWCSCLRMAKLLVLHPDTPVRTAEGFEIDVDHSCPNGSESTIEPVQYGGGKR